MLNLVTYSLTPRCLLHPPNQEDQVSCTVAGNKCTSQDTASSEVDIASKLHGFRLFLYYHIDEGRSLF